MNTPKYIKFITYESALIWLQDTLSLNETGAVWVYENFECPCWFEDKFSVYDFKGSPYYRYIPLEFYRE